MTRITSMILLALFTTQAHSQEQFYISDQQLVPLRSGPGGEYRIVHRGIPSGTQMVVNERSEDDTYARITTTRGTEGWVRSQYLTTEIPPRSRVAELETRNQALEQQLGSVNELLQELRGNYQLVSGELEGKDQQLALTGGELAEIRRISSNALTLDSDNRQLVEQTEVLKSRLELLEADNRRLLDSAENEAFLNGALAVGLGVLITLLVPRLWPKRRRSTSWA